LSSPALRNYHLLDTVAGHLRMEVGERSAAALRFHRAWDLATLDADRELLRRSIAAAEGL
jgi:predicted RNA polymerase sigma factor